MCVYRQQRFPAAARGRRAAAGGSRLRANPARQPLGCLAAAPSAGGQELPRWPLFPTSASRRAAGGHRRGSDSQGGDEARTALQRLLIRDPEPIAPKRRPGSVAKAGDDVAVFASAKDPSWQVRRSVARALSRFPTQRGATIARQLLADQSSEVRRAVLWAVNGWPLAQSAPILLVTMAEAPYQTRKQARRATRPPLAPRGPLSSGCSAGPAQPRTGRFAECLAIDAGCGRTGCQCDGIASCCQRVGRSISAGSRRRAPRGPAHGVGRAPRGIGNG